MYLISIFPLYFLNCLGEFLHHQLHTSCFLSFYLSILILRAAYTEASRYSSFDWAQDERLGRLWDEDTEYVDSQKLHLGMTDKCGY